MDQSAVWILGRYNLRLFRPGENDATFTMEGGGVCVIACEQAGTDPGEIRFSLIWAQARRLGVGRACRRSERRARVPSAYKVGTPY